MDAELPIFEWLVFNEIAASADKDGRCTDNLELLRDALGVSRPKIEGAIRVLEARQVIAVGSGNIFIRDKWLPHAAAGDVRIEGVKRWFPQVFPNTDGFLLGTNVATREHAEFFRSLHQKNLPPNVLSPRDKTFFGREKASSADEVEDAGRAIPVSEEGSDGGIARGAEDGLPPSVRRERLKGDTTTSFLPEIMYRDRFDRFWDVYPRHDRKDDAIKQWNRAMSCDVDPEQIIEGAQRYAEFARKNNQPSYRLFQAYNFIRGASYLERWGADWRSREEQRPRAHLITTFICDYDHGDNRKSEWRFELWSNMHPRASEIKCSSLGHFTLDDSTIYYSQDLSLFMSFEEFYGMTPDGTSYRKLPWWKSAEGKKLISQHRS